MKKRILVLGIALVLFALVSGIVFAQTTDDQIRQAANILGVPFDALRQFVQTYRGNSQLSGKWEYNGERAIPNYGKHLRGFPLFEFSGNKYSFSPYKGNTSMEREEGTFSISNDKIELLSSNGKTEVYSFSRTENTIQISGITFVRKN